MIWSRITHEPVRLLSRAIGLGLLLHAAGPAAEEPARDTSFGDGSTVRTYRVYTYRQKDGVPVFTDKVPADQRYEVMEFSCYACDPNSRVDWGTTRLFTAEYRGTIEDAAREHGVEN